VTLHQCTYYIHGVFTRLGRHPHPCPFLLRALQDLQPFLPKLESVGSSPPRLWAVVWSGRGVDVSLAPGLNWGSATYWLSLVTCSAA
jgi:hypothetical protein